MNLHIVPDNVFVNKFYENLQELGIAGQNKLVVRTNQRKLKYIRHNLPFASLYSAGFDELTGATQDYQNVFIHQFTPLLYRWVATHDFNKLNWMVWGSDLYNLPFLKTGLYEELTKTQYIDRRISLQHFLYEMKVRLLHDRYREKAYSKVDGVLTWMTSEFRFARQHIPELKAAHHFFFYENALPYKSLDEILSQLKPITRKRPVYILGNSSTPELNHLDAVKLLGSQDILADLWIPISYGDAHYRSFLKRALSSYSGGELRFIEQYMDFQAYLQLLHQSDGLIMNNIRPQGYGNIFMMMYLGKEVFLNRKNISTIDLDHAGLAWSPVDSLNARVERRWSENKSAVMNILSHSMLLDTYKKLFS